MRSPADWRDSSKWCDFHQDHCHTTRDCRGLHDEVVELLNRGHLKNVLIEKAAKRNAPKAVNPILRSTEPVTPSSGQIISFIDDEATKLLNPHHDAFVISILVANYMIKRVLIDNDSLTNVLFLSCLKAMKID
ncbi:uncharacterized protein LOC119995509 [Tripterygium wilfordii]|uniref:uncharacterized protein LOC119995509 n=1 Tax=Tripterygium wilfordii TaxID=458696 RepID=UPI0018F83DD0|nr:uncharacterized protein LOC119995509 [Tripterygium wilfordii]